MLSGLFVASLTPLNSQQSAPSGSVPSGTSSPPDGYSIKATVRRVVVDVVVTDSQGNPKRGLTEKDFSVDEDGKPQRILSFDPHKDDEWTGVLPANVPPNTFIDLPREPEQGPLYVLLYDMVNTGYTPGDPDHVDTASEIFARQQLLKFVAGKPPGSRFALLAISDGLHLIQGFTTDKKLLNAALDPEGKTPHMPKVFLYSSNYHPLDPYYYLAVMKEIGQYLEGIPGRKNVIWVSKLFPFAVFASSPNDLAHYVRKELAAMAASQIAIYPIDATGCCEVGGQNFVEDEVAEQTGGHAFYSSNDLVDSITKATGDGDVYYTLSYSSTNKNYDGKLRHIEVKLAQQGYHLAYRREYYADVEAPVAAPLSTGPTKPPKSAAPDGPVDTLYAYIRHGAPMSHDLLFSAHVQATGAPKLATPEQMADLAEEPAYFRKRRKDRPAAPLPPVLLQSYTIDYGIPYRQFRLQEATDQDVVEFASAAYDANGVLLNGNISNGALVTQGTGKYYQAVQQFEVPVTAAWICLVVRDVATGRIGNLEFSLPLAPEEAKTTGTH